MAIYDPHDDDLQETDEDRREAAALPRNTVSVEAMIRLNQAMTLVLGTSAKLGCVLQPTVASDDENHMTVTYQLTSRYRIVASYSWGGEWRMLALRSPNMADIAALLAGKVEAVPKID